MSRSPTARCIAFVALLSAGSWGVAMTEVAHALGCRGGLQSALPRAEARGCTLKRAPQSRGDSSNNLRSLRCTISGYGTDSQPTTEPIPSVLREIFASPRLCGEKDPPYVELHSRSAFSFLQGA